MHYLLIKIQLLWAKHTKWLDRNPVKVPVSKRVIAYAIDWAVGGIISGFPAVLFYGGITGRSDMFSDLYVFPSLGFPTYWSYLAGILCIVVAFIYYIYIFFVFQRLNCFDKQRFPLCICLYHALLFSQQRLVI